MDTKIFIYSHKAVKYGVWDNSLYTPLEVGAARREQIYQCRDNVGDNISEWNAMYAENTGLYWLWRQIEGAEAQGLKASGAQGLKYIGTCQYRRRLEFAEDTDFKKIFKEHDIILPKPLVMGVPVAMQYGMCHNPEDIKSMEGIVKDLYPDYAEDWNKYINKGNTLYYSSGMVMKKKDFIKYCKWLFPLFDEWKKRHNINSVEDCRKYVEGNIKAGKHRSTRGLDYQMQLFGFLQERLFTLYVKHNFKTPLEIPYKKFENVGLI